VRGRSAAGLLGPAAAKRLRSTPRLRRWQLARTQTLAAGAAQKLFGFPLPVPAEAPPFVLYVAGPIELIGGMLVMIGLATRPAAFLCSGLMAAAYWMAHGLGALLPIVNQGEPAALYCFVFLYIAARGAGPWSVDRA
jgi:putative oxidoreductase